MPLRLRTQNIEQAQKDEKLRGMGTTMVVATIVGQYAYVANVGDSRLYVVDKQLRQITRIIHWFRNGKNG